MVSMLASSVVDRRSRDFLSKDNVLPNISSEQPQTLCKLLFKCLGLGLVICCSVPSE
jgi:hypothetical protein